MIHSRSLILLIEQGRNVDIDVFWALIVRVGSVFDFLYAVVWTPLRQFLDVGNVQVCVIFVDSIDSSHIIHIQKVEALLD